MMGLVHAAANGDPKAGATAPSCCATRPTTDVLSFQFTGGFLNKIEGAHMVASGNEVAIESAEWSSRSLTMKLARRNEPLDPASLGAGRLSAAQRPGRRRRSTLRTDIAGFVGIAERGPVGVAVAVESMRQFQAVFGELHRRRLPRL